jgi:uncharacterized protein (DUF433 family)
MLKLSGFPQSLTRKEFFMTTSSENLLARITLNKEILGGKPIIRGMRISVGMILELLAKGAPMQEILEDYPELEMADIQAALFYAHHLVENEEVFERIVAS